MNTNIALQIVFALAICDSLRAGDPPSAALSQFCQAHLDQILAPIDQNIALPHNELTQLRGSFAVWMAKAPANESAAWRAALGLCDALNGAMNEREKAQIGVQNASDIHATDLGARRKDRPRYLEYQRERDEQAKYERDAARKDVFLNGALRRQWAERATQLRQQITNLQGRLQQRELQAQQAGGQPTEATDMVTLQKATQVTVKYGTVTLPAGSELHVVSRARGALRPSITVNS